MAAGEWSAEAKIKPDPDLFKKLTHMPEIVAQLTQMAADIAAKAGAGHSAGDYGIIVQNWPNTKRARAFALPTNSAGIHLELTQHLVLKAAVGSTNKTISKAPSTQASTMGKKEGDSGGTVAPGGSITPKAVPSL